MRVLCHSQTLSGVGHFVRMNALARGLAEEHEVHFVRGSRTVARPGDPGRLRFIDLPPLVRSGGALVAADGVEDIAAVLAARAGLLAEAAREIRPDVILIDHYPFSKWDLEAEVNAMIDAARAVNARARVACSLRDIVRPSRFERCEQDEYENYVVSALTARYDALFLHSDPNCTRLEDHFTRAVSLPSGVHYTGIVVDAPPPPSERLAGPEAVLSCGGGGWNGSFLLEAIEAFRRLSREGVLGRMRLRVYPGAFSGDGDLAALAEAALGDPIEIASFGPEFESRLQNCDLSISRAGYNTCAAILRAGVRAVLAPDPIMSDQRLRAARFEELGVAVTVAPDSQDAATIAGAIRRALAEPKPRHHLDLGGVARTRAWVEELLAS